MTALAESYAAQTLAIAGDLFEPRPCRDCGGTEDTGHAADCPVMAVLAEPSEEHRPW